MLTWTEVKPKAERNFGWMRDSVRESFDKHLNMATLLQVCCNTEALARSFDGTVVELPGDGHLVFPAFVTKYFPGFDSAATPLGRFYINKDRGAPTGKPVEVNGVTAFYYLHRHGVAHEHFQKANSRITRTSDAGPQPYLSIEENPHGVMAPDGRKTHRLHVHLDPLVDDFCAAVDAYLEDLVAPGSTTLQAHCVARFEFMLR